MRATVWSGRNSVSVENVPDPNILNDRDAIVKISSTAICGSDLHLYDGYVPKMKRGDILGHEFMGEVVEKGKGVGNLEVGDRVVVPFAIASAILMGAEQVVAIDQYDYRLQMAVNKAGATDVIDFSQDPDIVEQLKELTGGRGPDAVIDCVGMEAAHGHGALHAVDRVKQSTRTESDRPHALRDAILACRPGGIVSVMGVYGGLMDKFPSGAFMNKALQLRTGQCPVHRYLKPLYEHVKKGDIDPSFVVTHRLELSYAPDAYETFKHKRDECVKVVLKP